MGVQASEKALKSQYCPNSQVQCSAASFPINLTECGWTGLGEASVWLAVFIQVMMALVLLLPCIYISALATETGYSVRFSSNCCRFSWDPMLTLGVYGGGERCTLGWWKEAACLCDSTFCLTTVVAKTQLSHLCIQSLPCSLP